MRDFDYLWGVEICLAVMQGGHEMFFSYNLSMSDKKFYIRRYRLSDGKAQDLDGKDLSLEDDFGHVFYKSLTGVNSRGEQKGLYVETFPESDSARVWLSSTAREAQTKSVLTLYVFGESPDKTLASSSLSVTDMISKMEEAWHSLYDKLESCFILWHDDYRQRKALYYVKSATEPKSDVIKGFPYLQCEIILENVFGKTFPMGDKTIEAWLDNGGN